MAGGQRLISWLHPCSTSNVALNTRTSAHGPLMDHPNWAGCDTSARAACCQTQEVPVVRPHCTESQDPTRHWSRGRPPGSNIFFLLFYLIFKCHSYVWLNAMFTG
jgi:hypothetical protein